LEIAIADKSTNSSQSENKEFFKPELHAKLMTNTKEETTINEAAVSTKSVTSERPSTPKKLDEVVAAASDMKPQPFERPNIIENFLSTFDCMCGAPKLSNKTINEEDPSKESSTSEDLPVVHDPIVTEVVPSSGELNVPSKESFTADFLAIRDPIVAGESNRMERSNSLNSVTTDFTDDAFSAEKIKEARLDEATNMASKALDEKENTSERPSTPKKLDEVVAAASDMKPQPFERPNIIENFLSTFDCMCGAPKLSNKTINEEDPSKESSTTVDLPVVHDPIVTEVVPSSGELNVPSKESFTADFLAIRDPIVAGESNRMERSNSLNSVTTDFTDDAFSAEKIKEARLDEAANMANKALDEKEKMNKKKAKFSFGLSSKLVKIRTLNQRTNEMKSVAGHYMRTKKHDFKTQKETVELANSQSLNEHQTSSSFEGKNEVVTEEILKSGISTTYTVESK
jgi:hypothetical protein